MIVWWFPVMRPHGKNRAIPAPACPKSLPVAEFTGDVISVKLAWGRRSSQGVAAGRKRRASEACAGSIVSLPERSAIVRLTRSMR